MRKEVERLEEEVKKHQYLLSVERERAPLAVATRQEEEGNGEARKEKSSANLTGKGSIILEDEEKRNVDELDKTIASVQKAVVEENFELPKEISEPVEEFSVEVSSDEEPSNCKEETKKCEEMVGKKSLSKQVKEAPGKQGKGAPVKTRTPAKQGPISTLKKTTKTTESKQQKEKAKHKGKGEWQVATQAVSKKAQSQSGKDKCQGTPKEWLGPFECCSKNCHESWAKVSGWEKKVKITITLRWKPW